MSGTDPFEAVSRRQSYIKKDTVKYFIHANECITTDDLAAKRGTPKRILWRPPRDFIKQKGGALHGDGRGSFSKLLGSKVVFHNKTGVDIRLKASLPVGKITDPTSIYARPVITEGTIKGNGTRKEKSRTVGKKGKKREKSYSQAMDRLAIEVNERKLFSGDANLYTLYEEEMPGDDATSPTYKVMGKGIMDFVLILPNSNEFSGAKFVGELIVAEVIVVVRYVVSESGRGVDVSDMTDTKEFAMGSLNSLSALYHRDVDPVLGGGLMGLPVAYGSPLLMTPPVGDSRILVKIDRKAYLTWGNGDVFSWPELEQEGVRLTFPGVTIGSMSHEFGYEKSFGWVLMNKGNPVTFNSTPSLSDIEISGDSPVIVHVCRSRGLGKVHVDARAISWASVVSALTVTIKVLSIGLRFAQMFA